LPKAFSLHGNTARRGALRVVGAARPLIDQVERGGVYLRQSLVTLARGSKNETKLPKAFSLHGNTARRGALRVVGAARPLIDRVERGGVYLRQSLVTLARGSKNELPIRFSLIKEDAERRVQCRRRGTT
jgi:hypothetical protein